MRLKERMQHGTMVLSLVFAPLMLGACSQDSPGPLEGRWQLQGMAPMVIEFRRGESESLGLIEKVSYDVQGSDVIVTSESGPAKGLAVRYTMTGPDSARMELGTLRRIK